MKIVNEINVMHALNTLKHKSIIKLFYNYLSLEKDEST